MINVIALTDEIYAAFPDAAAPAKFRAECQEILRQGYNPEECNASDFVEVYLVFGGKRWQEISDRYINDGTFAFRVEESVNFLDMAAWQYYVPIFLLFYIKLLAQQNIQDAGVYSNVLQAEFGENYRRTAAAALSLPQKRCIAQVIKSAATDVPAGESAIEPECLAYWSQFL